MYRGTREDTCEHGLSRTSPRVKLLRAELESVEKMLTQKKWKGSKLYCLMISFSIFNYFLLVG